jgi:hypothetical protein
VAFLPESVDELLFGADIAFPFRLTPDGDLAEVVGEDAVMQALPIRAMTGLAEIPVYPDDGLDLEEFQNGLTTEVDRAVLRARVLTQYRREDRITSLTVETEDGPDGPSDTLVRLRADLPNGRSVAPTVAFGGE